MKYKSTNAWVDMIKFEVNKKKKKSFPFLDPVDTLKYVPSKSLCRNEWIKLSVSIGQTNKKGSKRLMA